MKYFKREEIARCFRENGARCRECPLKQPAQKLPDGMEANLDALVTGVLDPVREQLGKPIYVNSGYRCPKHNAAVGGAPNSQHIHGEAADIRCDDNETLRRLIKEQGVFDQMIIYPGFLHVSYKRGGANRHQVLRKTSAESIKKFNNTIN